MSPNGLEIHGVSFGVRHKATNGDRLGVVRGGPTRDPSAQRNRYLDYLRDVTCVVPKLKTQKGLNAQHRRETAGSDPLALRRSIPHVARKSRSSVTRASAPRPELRTQQWTHLPSRHCGPYLTRRHSAPELKNDSVRSTWTASRTARLRGASRSDSARLDSGARV